MKKKRITYGVSGMMEYQAVIKVGRNNMKVLFSDGSVSAMGVNPATFTTENVMVQHASENSPEFKRGRIAIVNTIVLDEDLPIVRNIEKPTETPTPATPMATGATEKTGTKTDAEESSVSNGHEDCADTSAPLTQVEFSCNDDAKDYLEQTFGYVRSKLRNREDIINAGKAHNVEIIFV